jgi:hypothetical protein
MMTMNNNSSFNEGTLGPNPPFPEVTTNTFDYIEAQNTRRQGSMQASEQLVQRGRMAGSFSSAAFTREGEQIYGVEIATGRSPITADLAAGSRGPMWDYLDQTTLAGFAQGDSVLENQASVRGFSHLPRAGANQNPLGPTWSFSVGAERPGNVVQAKIAPENGGRARRNIADVTDL